MTSFLFFFSSIVTDEKGLEVLFKNWVKEKKLLGVTIRQELMLC